MVKSKWWLCLPLLVMACTAPVARPEATLEPTRPAAMETVKPTEMATETATAVPTHTAIPAADTPTPPPTATATPSPTHTPLPTDTPHPTPTTVVTDQTYTVSENGIQFVMNASIAATVYPQLSDEDLQYREFLFAPDGLCREIGCLTFYEVDSFRVEIPGGDFVVDELVASLAADASTHIPTWGAAILLQAQTKSVDFMNGTGRRAIVMRGQDSFFANNAAVVYNFHGLTLDGRYYINVTIPIDIPFLIDTYDPAQNTNPDALPIPPLPQSYEEAVALIVEYNAQAAALIDELPEVEFIPDLALLDALVASIVVSDE